ncbi:hypothetical protein ACOSP7_024209 [Xanthoceras sorbifolium]
MFRESQYPFIRRPPVLSNSTQLHTITSSFKILLRSLAASSFCTATTAFFVKKVGRGSELKGGEVTKAQPVEVRGLVL